MVRAYFSQLFPRAAPARLAAMPTGTQDTDSRARLLGTGANVLVVDDEEAIAALMARMLQQLGHLTTVAHSVGEALAQCAQVGFDLVITDLMLPGGSGVQLARQLRALQPELAVVLATGCLTQAHTRDADAAGICALLPKPFSLPLLAAALQRAAARTCPA